MFFAPLSHLQSQRTAKPDRVRKRALAATTDYSLLHDWQYLKHHCAVVVEHVGRQRNLIASQSCYWLACIPSLRNHSNGTLQLHATILVGHSKHQLCPHTIFQNYINALKGSCISKALGHDITCAERGLEAVFPVSFVFSQPH